MYQYRVLVAALLFVVAFSGAGGVPWIVTRPPYTISQETTRVAGPLRPDGSVDFVAALNARLSEGVTPENNAAVVLWRAMGPPPHSKDEYRGRFFKLLGIPPLPEQGEYFLRLHRQTGQTGHGETYADRLDRERPLSEAKGGEDSIGGSMVEEDDWGLGMMALNSPERLRAQRESERAQSKELAWGGLIPASSGFVAGKKWRTWNGLLEAQLKTALQRPWAAKEFPELATWLEINADPLKVAVDGCGRPRFYSPQICIDDTPDTSAGDMPSMGSRILPEFGIKQLAEALAARAMLRLERGDVANAWNDTLAVHQLARLLAQGADVVHVLCAFELERRACAVGVAISLHGDVSAMQAAKIRSDLRSLAPFPRAAGSFETTRFYALDSVCAASQGNLEQGTDSLWARMQRALCDWDEVLRRINDHFDRAVLVGRLARGPKRTSLLSELDNEIQQAWKAKEKRGASTDGVYGTFLGLSAPAYAAVLASEDRAAATLRVAEVALALAAYRADHDRYPDTLSDLVCSYFEEVPMDPCGEGELVYRLEGSGYSLYSVGVDGEDDGGVSISLGGDILVWTPCQGADAIPALETRLQNKSREVRSQAAGILGEIGEPAIPALINALGDKDREVIRSVRGALAAIGPKAIPALEKALQNDNQDVRRNTAYALDEMGAEAREAIPALEQALKDPHEDVRSAATQALEAIRLQLQSKQATPEGQHGGNGPDSGAQGP